jgi:hypothetical protein
MRSSHHQQHNLVISDSESRFPIRDFRFRFRDFRFRFPISDSRFPILDSMEIGIISVLLSEPIIRYLCPKPNIVNSQSRSVSGFSAALVYNMARPRCGLVVTSSILRGVAYVIMPLVYHNHRIQNSSANS